MPRLSILRKTLRDLRWQVWWYGVGLALLGALVVFIYPSYREELATFEIPEALQALVGEIDYGTPEGFLTAEFFSWGPLLGIIFAIMAGTAALGSEESTGTLDLLLAQPISRSSLILQKMAGFAAGAVALALFVDLGWLLSVPFVAIDISLTTLLIATFLMVPSMTLVYSLAIFATAYLPDRKVATGFVTAVVVVSFFANYLAALVDILSPIRWASFFNYQNSEVLVDGLDLARLIVMLAGTLVFSTLAVVAFDRREIGVHARLNLRPWARQRGRSAGDPGAQDEADPVDQAGSPARPGSNA